MTIKSIPIQNIYYLLAYAWKEFRDGEFKDIASTDCPDSVNLLAHLLGDGIAAMAKHGIDKGYRTRSEDTARLRGRFNIADSYRRALHLTGRLNCAFDELTVDTLPNQILKSTCVRLIRASNLLTKENRVLIRNSDDLFDGVSVIRISNNLFRRIQLHRNNRKYRFLLNICELLNNCYSPSEASGSGRFRDFLQDDVQMSRIFEKFVLQFARKHCVGADVRSMQISWDGVWDSGVAEVLPTMKTDVTIDHPDGKTILDCKFYRQALVTRYDRKRLHSSHLYQLTAYLTNQARHPGWENVKGILLYPAVDHHLNHVFELQGHPVEVRSIDLDLPWKDIHEKLLRIVANSDVQALPPSETAPVNAVT